MSSDLAGLVLAGLLLAGCSATPTPLGEKVASPNRFGHQELSRQKMANTGLVQAAREPSSTGTIVPMRDEGKVIDLPDSSIHGEAYSDLDEEDLTPEERHRRELINRGELEEGAYVPGESN